MPGPVSESYRGPSDRKPKVPEWALPCPKCNGRDATNCTACEGWGTLAAFKSKQRERKADHRG